MLHLLLLACSSSSAPDRPLDPEGLQAVETALAVRLDAPPADDWTPDVRLDLSREELAGLLQGALARKGKLLTGVIEVDGGRLTNEANLSRSALQPTIGPCGDAVCMGLVATYAGKTSAATTEAVATAPFEAVGTLQYALGTREVHGRQEVYAESRELALDLAWEDPRNPLADLYTEPVKTWLGKALLELPDVILLRSPVEPEARAVRTSLHDGGLTVDLLTDRTEGGLAAAGPLPETGFRLTVTSDLIAHLATAGAFDQAARRRTAVTGIEGGTHGLSIRMRHWDPSDGAYDDTQVRSLVDLERPRRPPGVLSTKRKQQEAKHTRLTLMAPTWTTLTGEPLEEPGTPTSIVEDALTWAAGVALPDITGVPSTPTRPVLTGLTATADTLVFTGAIPE